jgi:hypothetical protein
MLESVSVLSSWENFYVIVGSSAGALIGLQFVVLTLIADRRHLATPGSLSAFGTPTVVHLAGALVLSAIMSAPWPSLVPLSLALGIAGLIGIAYGGIVLRRAHRQSDYEPDWDDWLWYTILPFASYAVLTVTAAFLRAAPQPLLFVIGAVVFGLLLIGIHNAWDSVTYIVVFRPGGGTTQPTGDPERPTKDLHVNTKRGGSQPPGRR